MNVRAAAAAVAFGALGVAAPAEQQRIVSLDGTTTEIVSALGAGDELVGRDDSSYYPDSVRSLPSIGYQFTLDAESILSLRPTLVLGRDDVKPQAAVDQVRAAGVDLVLLRQQPSIAGAQRKIRRIAALVGRTSTGRSLIEAMNGPLATLARRLSARGRAPRARVLVLLGVSPGTAFACGADTGPGAAIALAGADNALPAMQGCKRATSEAVISANPSAIVALSTPGAGRMPLDDVPGIAQTPAAHAHREYALDALYLAGFGPREGRALLELFDDLYPAR